MMTNQMMQMKNNLTRNYLIQTKQLFGNEFIRKDVIETKFATSYGDDQSKFLFIKNFNEIKNFEEKEFKLLNKIVLALNLEIKNIFLLNLNNSKECIPLTDYFEKLNPMYIIIFGKTINTLIKKEMFENSKFVITYSIEEMINDSSLKKNVWEDLKLINNINNG